MADGARGRPADAQAGAGRKSHIDVVGARPARPSRRLHGVLRVEVRGRRHHQGARLRMGRDGYHRQCAWPHRLPLAAHRLDVRGHRSGARRTQRLPGTRAEGPPGRTRGSRGASALPRVARLRLLYRPYPLRRRWLHGGLSMTEKARIAVIGAGLMGHGLAQVFALGGHDVTIYDAIDASLGTVQERISTNLRDLGDDPRAVERVRPTGDLADCLRDVDYVVEAVSEDLPLKQKLFAEIETHVRDDTILASNTSVIPITDIMRGLRERGRALGTHWWNPPYLVPLVEVIGTEWTTPAAIDWTMQLHSAVGKTPAHVKKDVPGFIGNRLQHSLLAAAAALVAHGVFYAVQVDTVIKASFGRRLAVLGPLENADLVGTDLTLAIHDIVLPAIESSTAPSPYLRQLVEAKKLGMKSGEGFRRWSAEQQAELRKRVLDHLKQAREKDA